VVRTAVVGMAELPVLQCDTSHEYIPVKLTFADVGINGIHISVLAADRLAAQLEHDLTKRTNDNV